MASMGSPLHKVMSEHNTFVHIMHKDAKVDYDLSLWTSLLHVALICFMPLLHTALKSSQLLSRKGYIYL